MESSVARAFLVTEQFPPLPVPGPNDWLTSHPERPQSVAAYAGSLPNLPRPPRDTIVIVALSKLDGADGPRIDGLVEYARRYFGLPVRVWRGLDVDDLHPRRRTHQGESQLNATDVLDALEAKVPTDAYCVIALTTEDLYPDDTFNFVFGMARLKARVGVFSFARYGDEQPRLAVQRAFKIMTHELGHMFGMGHCTHFACNMNGGNHLQELDATPMHLCPVCLRKLHMATGLDPGSRYRALRGVYRTEGLHAEAEWIDRRLEYLTAAPADR